MGAAATGSIKFPVKARRYHEALIAESSSAALAAGGDLFLGSRYADTDRIYLGLNPATANVGDELPLVVARRHGVALLASKWFLDFDWQANAVYAHGSGVTSGTADGASADVSAPYRGGTCGRAPKRLGTLRTAQA